MIVFWRNSRILALDYPRDRLEVVFADGGSTDGTADRVAGAVQAGEPYRVVRCRRGGKIAQWNEVLPDLHGEILVNTDVDAQLEADALKWIAAEFAADERVQVVGAIANPSTRSISSAIIGSRRIKPA